MAEPTRATHVREWLKLLMQLIVAVIALLTLSRGVAEYKDAQRWKKSELAAQELDRLTSDPLLQFALQVIEWPSRKVIVPEPYVQMPDLSQSLDHASAKLDSAVLGTTGRVWPGEYGNARMVLYVDAIDRLFTYLEQVNHYIEVGLINVRDVCDPLSYWLSRTTTHRALRQYIDDWSYDGVTELATRLNGPACGAA